MQDLYEDLDYRVDKGVATVTLNRPEKLNAMTQRLYREIGHALIRADLDESVEAVVITGAGRAFCSGGDLGEVNDLHGEDARIELASWPGKSHATFQQLLDMSKPVIARVNGLAHAGGFNLVLNSDISISVESATFRMPQGLRGMATPTAAQIAQCVGVPRAKYLLMAAPTLSAKEALDWGLIARVVPEAELDSAVMEVLEQVVSVQPLSRRYTKSLINRSLAPADLSVLIESMASDESEVGTRQFAH